MTPLLKWPVVIVDFKRLCILLAAVFQVLPSYGNSFGYFSASVIVKRPGTFTQHGELFVSGKYARFEGSNEGPEVVVIEQLGDDSQLVLFPQNSTYSHLIQVPAIQRHIEAFVACPHFPRIRCELNGMEIVDGGTTERWLIRSMDTNKLISTRWIDKELRLAVRTLSADGTVIELVKVVKQRPAAHLFRIPRGYRDVRFPPPPLDRFEVFITSFVPLHGTAPFTAEMRLQRTGMPLRKARLSFDGKDFAFEIGSYVVIDQNQGRTRVVLNSERREYLADRRKKLTSEVPLTDTLCAAWKADGLRCRKTTAELIDDKASVKSVFADSATNQDFATVWFDRTSGIPIRAVSTNGSVADLDVTRSAPSQEIFTVPSNYSSALAIQNRDNVSPFLFPDFKTCDSDGCYE